MNTEPLNAFRISTKYEALYEMLLESIPSSVLLIDKSLAVVSANRNFLEKNNLSLSETIGQKLEIVFPDVILQSLPVLDQIRGVFQNNVPTHGQRLTCRAPGVPRSVYYYRILPVIRQGVVENVMFLMDDITRQVQLSEKIQQVERHLASVVESATEMEFFQSQKLAALGVMAGGVAHEIRNPLAISSSAAQFLMKDDITPEFRKECAAKVNSGIKRAAAIIDNLIKFARPASKHRIEQVELISLLQETVSLVFNQAKIQQIEIISNLSGKSISVQGSYGLLQQLFLNLFLNAIAAMPNGGVLTLSAESRGGDVLLQITDTGDGIPGKNIDKIFDPFFTTASIGEGIGLGLSIAYAIVKQHTGSIAVSSAKGKGSRFIVKLPERCETPTIDISSR